MRNIILNKIQRNCINGLLKCKLTLIGFAFPFFITSQEIPYRSHHFGLNAGLNLSFGTHVQRLGLVFNAAYVNDHFQANFESRYYFNFRDLGPPKKGEFAASLGILYGYGRTNTWYNPFYNAVSNQTMYKYCFAYAFNTYVNRIRTSQRTGTIAFQIDRITVINENDLFAPPSFDAFRTGGLLIQYQQDSLFQAAVNCTMWTGKMGFKTQNSDPHFRFGCYMDTTGNIFGNYSHGMLSGQLKYYLGYGQNAQLNIGVDAEQVRNVIQNEITHDMHFLPASWIKSRNCHIPMLDDKGNQYLYRADQTIRPPKFYFNIGGNENLFY